MQTEKTGSAVTSYIREPSGNLVYQKLSSGQTFYYYFDGLGSVIGQMDSGGNQRAKYTYDPFGAHASETGVNGAAPANPWRWMGGYLDASTGLYHFGERYYDQTRGSFLQIDPIDGGSASRYGYCSGDPLNCSDLTGTFGIRQGLANLKKFANKVPWGAVLSVGAAGASILFAGSGLVSAIAIGLSAVSAYQDCFGPEGWEFNTACKLSLASLGVSVATGGLSKMTVLTAKMGKDLTNGAIAGLEVSGAGAGSWCSARITKCS